MDKYEYKIRADEIKELIAQGEYAQAAEIADSIDWRRVKSVMMLCTISDLYKINRRYEDARDMLLLAYERRPGGRTICYSLCELSIKMEEFVQAVEYYKEFVQIAPKDPGRYILQYKLYEAQDVSLEERIEVLEELKKRDYREKWAYELAYLYHRVGLATRCVEECDELILWFGEGKYVVKAMELKMLHQPLTPDQQEKYDHRFDAPAEYEAAPTVYNGDNSAAEQPYGNETYGDGYADQGAYEEGHAAREAYGDGYADQGAYEEGYAAQGAYGEENTAQQAYVNGYTEPETYGAEAYDAQTSFGDTKVYGNAKNTVVSGPWGEGAPAPEEDLDIHVKTVDVGQYNTINLQAELAAGLKEVLGDDNEAINQPSAEQALLSGTETPEHAEAGAAGGGQPAAAKEEIEETEVFFGETGEIGDLQQAAEDMTEVILPEEEPAQSTAPKSALQQENNVPDVTGEIVMEQMRLENTSPDMEKVLYAEPPRELAEVLAQEPDGQISLVMPESDNLEKQITGQMNIQDVLAEWERMKKENQEKRKEEVRKHVLEQTGSMFTEFEEAVRDGLLEQLESGKKELPEPAVEPEETQIGDEGEAVEAEALEIETAETEAADMEPEETVSDETIPSEAEITEPMEELWAEDEGTIDYEEIPDDEAAEYQEEFADEVEELEEIEEAPEEVYEEEPEIEPEELETWEETEETETGEEEAGELEAEEEGGEPATGKGTEETETGEEETEEPKAGKSKTASKSEIVRDKARVRSLTREERELYAPFIQSKSAREQLVKTIDNISMAAFTGNVIITGEEGMDTFTLAKNMIREVQMTDSNFSGKVAKISGQALNQKDVGATVEHLKNGALIIQKASGMNEKTIKDLHKCLQQEHLGIIVILEDTRKAIDKMLAAGAQLFDSFSARMDVEAMSNESLVAFGRQYARELEYSIDELGVLALHTRIEDLQTIDHVVTVVEVKEIVDEAIRHANRKTIGHFFDILFAKRYDDEDMIVLSEKDFV